MDVGFLIIAKDLGKSPVANEEYNDTRNQR